MDVSLVSELAEGREIGAGRREKKKGRGEGKGKQVGGEVEGAKRGKEVDKREGKPETHKLHA
jgi:hypothetical protein